MKLFYTQDKLQNAAVATGNGTPLATRGMASLGLQVSGTFVGTVAFEATLDGANWIALQAVDVRDGSVVTTATAPGVFVAACAGISQVRARISAYSSGNITVVGLATTASASQILADVQIGTGTFSIGKIAIDDGQDATLGAKADAPADVDEDTTARSGVSLWKGIKNYLRSVKATLGATTGAAVTTDADGTLQQYLRGLVKLIIAKIGITVADGDNATLGAKADAPVDADEDTTARSGISLWKGIKNYLRNLVGQFAAATVTEYNITLTNAGQEYSQALPANCRKVIFRCRTNVEIRYAWVTGKVAGPTAPYQTLKAGADYGLDGIKSSGTLYWASAVGGPVIEMEVWS